MSYMRDPFEYQAPTPSMIEHISQVRDACKRLHEILQANVPPSAERTLAIRKLEECFAWCSKAIVFEGERYIT